MITQSHIDATLLRCDDLLAEAARARLVTTAIQPPTSATPRPVGRFSAGLRQAVAALVALAAIG